MLRNFILLLTTQCIRFNRHIMIRLILHDYNVGKSMAIKWFCDEKKISVLTVLQRRSAQIFLYVNFQQPQAIKSTPPTHTHNTHTHAHTHTHTHTHTYIYIYIYHTRVRKHTPHGK